MESGSITKLNRILIESFHPMKTTELDFTITRQFGTYCAEIRSVFVPHIGRQDWTSPAQSTPHDAMLSAWAWASEHFEKPHCNWKHQNLDQPTENLNQ